MKHKFWKRAAAFALALTLVMGVSPVNVGNGGLADRAEIVADAADKTLAVDTVINIGDTVDYTDKYFIWSSTETVQGSGSATINKPSYYADSESGDNYFKFSESVRFWVETNIPGARENYLYTLFVPIPNGGSTDPDDVAGIKVTEGSGTEESPFSFDIVYSEKKAVTYDANGHGTAPAVQKVTKNTTTTAPTITDAGFEWIFGGWYTESTCEHAFDFANTPITQAMTLYAKWTKAPYTITLAGNAANLFSVNGRRASQGDTIEFSVNDGYTFNGTPTVTAGGSPVSISGDNGSYTFAMPDTNVTISVPENSFERASYSITSGTNIASLKVDNADVTSAYVDDAVEITVDFPKNSAGTVDTTKTLKQINVITTSGTALTPEIKKTAYNKYQLKMPAENVTVSAEFADLESYTVFYFGNAEKGRTTCRGLSEESTLDEDIVLDGTTVRSMLVNAVDATEMQFQYQDDDGLWSNPKTIPVITTDIANIAEQATPLEVGIKVAIVKGEAKMVGVSFVADATKAGGTLNYFTVSKGTITLPEAPIKEGYGFQGWTSENGNASKKITGTSITAPEYTENGNNILVLNALWAQGSYTVTFDSDGGTPIDNCTVTNGNKLTEPDEPTKDGYLFSKWVVAKDCGSLTEGEAFDFDTVITGDLKLKAEWKHVHSYSYYPVDAEIFKGRFDVSKATAAHVKLCNDCGRYQIVAHHFNMETGECACGYKVDPSDYVTVHNMTDNTDKQVMKGTTCTFTAPETNADGDQFVRWGYGVGQDVMNTLSNNRSVTFSISKSETAKVINVYAFYDTKITEPEINMIARPAIAGNEKAIQFYADYRLPDGWKATDFVLKVGDNDQLFYFKPDSISLWSGFKDSFLNMIGKKKLGGYYCFEEVDDSLMGQISSFFKATFSKVPVYYPREDNVMTSKEWDGKTLADKMYDGKGITVEDMELMGSQLNSPGKSGYIYKNVIPSAQGYGLPKDGDRIFYAMGYLTCEDANGKKRTYIIDAISATANDVASDTEGKGPVVSTTKHTTN